MHIYAYVHIYNLRNIILDHDFIYKKEDGSEKNAM